MTPFPGESLGIRDAYRLSDVDDDTVYQAIWLREGAFDGAPTSATLTPPETWRAWTWDNDLDYLAPTDDTTGLVVSWVVEVLSGSATVDVFEGIDPDYAGTPDAPGLAPTSLGTVTLTAGTNVIASTVSADHVRGDGVTNGGAPVLELACTAGSAVVQQVKMRVWPETGPAGAWVKQDEWQTNPAPPVAYLPQTSENTAQTVNRRADTYEESWDLALAAAVGGPPLGTYTHRSTNANPDSLLITGNGTAQQALTELTPAISTGVTTQAGIAAFEAPDWTTLDPINPALTDGVDYTRPPAEVRYDTAYFAQLVGAGSFGWSGMFVTWEVGGEAPMGAVGLYVAGQDDLTTTEVVIGPGDIKYDVPLTVGFGVGLVGSMGTFALPTDFRVVVVAISHSFLTNTEEWPGTTGGALGGPIYGLDGAATIGSDDAPLRAWAVMPPFRVWVPGAVEVATTKLRQYHRDDGLGVAPKRAYGGASRNRTRRAYGYT